MRGWGTLSFANSSPKNSPPPRNEHHRVSVRKKTEMTMTMQETKEAILAMLSAANGLEARPHGPVSFALDEYIRPGNYAKAESVERGTDGDKFNWVAYSSYREEDYVHSQDLKAQLERVFSDNELCQNVHVTIHHNEDEMAHRVEYRFQTFGVEPPESPDGPDFCSSRGWNTQHMKWNAGPDDHPDEACHYLCANCGKDTGLTTPCIRGMTLNIQFRSRVFLTNSSSIVSAVSPDVSNAVGEILMGYALAENNLRAMMVNLPGHNPRSNLSTDIERLKKHKAAIVESASAKSADGGQEIGERVNAIIHAFDKTRAKRNAIAHGQLMQVGLLTSIIGIGNPDHDKDQGSRLQIEHDGETVELTEAGIQETLDNARELQTQIGNLGRLLQFLANR